jgi:hypothetical protein
MSSGEQAELYRIIRELTKEVSTLSVTVARLEQQMIVKKECSNPGACVLLATRVDALERKALLAEGKREGLTLAGKAAWAFIGGGGLAVVAAVYSLMKRPPAP